MPPRNLTHVTRQQRLDQIRKDWAVLASRLTRLRATRQTVADASAASTDDSVNLVVEAAGTSAASQDIVAQPVSYHVAVKNSKPHQQTSILDIASLAAAVLPASPVAATHQMFLQPVEEAPADVLEVGADLLPDLVAESEDLMSGIEVSMEAWRKAGASALPELRRQVHTLKGVAGMAGARSSRGLLHAMEERLEEIEDDGLEITAKERSDFDDRFTELRRALNELFASPAPQTTVSQTATPAILPRQIRLSADSIEHMTTEIGEANQASMVLSAHLADQRGALRESVDVARNMDRLLRDLSIYADSQIQSRRAMLAPGEEFDPLELDRYTQLQELSRALAESAADATDLRRSLHRTVAEQETTLAYQARAIDSVRSGMHKARLTPVEDLADRLYRVVWSTGHELGKSVVFDLDAPGVELDRALIERLLPPLEHLLRNAVDHGLEPAATRAALGKPATGRILVQVRTSAGRVEVQVEDDGSGLDIARIRQRAIERGLWPASSIMDASAAAEMICQPGFSTARQVTQISGRGIGMDVVRASVLSLGGRFEVTSTAGQGTRVILSMPTLVSAASVLIVGAGGERLAIPVDLVEDVERPSAANMASALAAGAWSSGDQRLRCVSLSTQLGLPALTVPVFLVKIGQAGSTGTQMALAVDSLADVIEAHLRPAGPIWRSQPLVTGLIVLPDGQATFLVDPRVAAATPIASAASLRRVMVVDDAITVRRATVRFLERMGVLPIMARDGREALDLLMDSAVAPDAVLLDIEMPRMNGFELLAAMRADPRLQAIPVIMISSRTADKHRDRATSLGAMAYLGKPFHEGDLMTALERAFALPPPVLTS